VNTQLPNPGSPARGLVIGWGSSYSEAALSYPRGERMSTHVMKMAVTVTGIAAVTLMSVLPVDAIAQSHAQEAKNLISAHKAMEMKIDSLQDRVRMASVRRQNNSGFGRDDMSGRTNGGGSSNGRIPERLQHKDRAASDGGDYSRIKADLSAFEKKAKRERERVMRPSFGTDRAQSEKEIANARRALNALQRELSVLERQLTAL